MTACVINKPYKYILSIDIAVYSGFIYHRIPFIFIIMNNNDGHETYLLGSRIRSLRTKKGWTQQELGNRADVNYKFIGEIERGQQNPSFNVLSKIAIALEVRLSDLFRFEHETLDRKEVESRIKKILQTAPDEDLRKILMIIQVLYPYQH